MHSDISHVSNVHNKGFLHNGSRGGVHVEIKVFSHQQRSGSNRFENPRKHNIVKDASSRLEEEALLLAAVIDDES
jgi:hypothetical protein